MKLLRFAFDTIAIIGFILLLLVFAGFLDGIFELIVGGLNEVIHN